MKTLTVSNSSMQATMTVDYLKSRGIDAFSRGSREYASIVTGSDMGRYEILVPEDQLEEAQKHLKQLQLQIVEQEQQDEDPSEPQSIPDVAASALKRSIVFGTAGFIVIPIFNLFSLYFLYVYLKNASGFMNRFLVGTLLLIFNVGGWMFFADVLYPNLYKGLF